MNNQEHFREDPLRQYINPQGIEEAPDGFTLKVMASIGVEANPALSTDRSKKRNLVPAVSAAVTLLLILAAILIPANGSGSSAFSVLELLKNINITLPKIDFSSIFNTELPST